MRVGVGDSSPKFIRVEEQQERRFAGRRALIAAQRSLISLQIEMIGVDFDGCGLFPVAFFVL